MNTSTQHASVRGVEPKVIKGLLAAAEFEGVSINEEHIVAYRQIGDREHAFYVKRGTNIYIYQAWETESKGWVLGVRNKVAAAYTLGRFIIHPVTETLGLKKASYLNSLSYPKDKTPNPNLPENPEVRIVPEEYKEFLGINYPGWRIVNARKLDEDRWAFFLVYDEGNPKNRAVFELEYVPGNGIEVHYTAATENLSHGGFLDLPTLAILNPQEFGE